MPIVWNDPLQASHEQPRVAILLPDDHVAGPILGKRRVSILGDFAASLPKNDPRSMKQTVFLFDEQGRCNCSGQPSPFDLVNAAETLAQAA